MPSGSITLPVNTIELTPDEAREWNAKSEAEYLATHKHPNALCVRKAVEYARESGHAEGSRFYRFQYENGYVLAADSHWPTSLREYVTRLRAAKTLAEWQAAAFTEGA